MASNGLSKSRVSANKMASCAIRKARRRANGKLLQQLMPEDLLEFGLILSSSAVLPIVVTLDALDELALRRILTEPRMRWCASSKKS